MASGIYQWVNKVNQKRYIGSSDNIDRRRNQHLKALRSGCHFNCHFQAAWNQHGEDQFSFNILKECDPDDLILWEQTYIDCYDPADLYNINLEVDRSPSCTEETRRKMSESLKGREITEQAKRKMSAAAKLRKASDQARQNMSLARKGKNQSESHRKNRALSQVGRVLGESSRQKISAKNRGRKCTEEEISRRRASLKNKKSDVFNRLISLARSMPMIEASEINSLEKLDIYRHQIAVSVKGDQVVESDVLSRYYTSRKLWSAKLGPSILRDLCLVSTK